MSNPLCKKGSTVYKLPAKKSGLQVGDEFRKLTVLGPAFYLRMNAGEHRQYVVCRCSCGNVCAVKVKSLKNGDTKSCGCWNVEVQRTKNLKHGFSKRDKYGGTHPLYYVWGAIVQRCTNADNKSYGDYGGRGIGVCGDWLDFTTFRDWCLGNGWAPGLTIDRENNNKGYSPENCRFVTVSVNNKNKRNNINVTAFGETKCASDWVRDKRCTVTFRGLVRRLKKGMKPELAITKPSKGRSNVTSRSYSESARG